MTHDSDTAPRRADVHGPRPHGRCAMQPAASRILETTRRIWRELSLDSPLRRGYCPVQSSSEAGETVILPDRPGASILNRVACRLHGAEGARNPANSQAKGPLRIGLSGE